MSIVIGGATRSLHGTMKTFTLSAPVPKETYLGGSPLILPTSEPGTAQFSYTVTAEDMEPTVSPRPLSFQICPIIHVAGRIGASTTTLNHRILLNGANVTTGNNPGIGANLNWTHNFVHSALLQAPIKVGDVIEVKMWSNQADTQLDYYAIVFYTCRLQLARKDTILRDVKYEYSGALRHTLALGRSPSLVSNQSAYHINSNLNHNVALNGATTIVPAMVQTVPAIPSSAIYGLWTVYFGDSGLRTTVSLRTHTSNHPVYETNSMPTTISFREYSR